MENMKNMILKNNLYQNQQQKIIKFNKNLH